MDPRSDEPVWHNHKINTEMEAQFSVAYNFSVAAHRLLAGPDWQASKTYKSAKILQFTRKVSFNIHSEYGQAVARDQKTRLNRVDVVSKGKVFSQEKEYPKGAPHSRQTRMSDQELAKKFINNSKKIISEPKAEAAAEMILGLENLKDVSKLVDLVVN